MYIFILSFYRLYCQLFKSLQLNLILDISIVKYPVWYLGNIEWCCISWVLVVLKYTIAKNIFWCLDKQRCDCFPIYVIAYNISPVLCIIVWHFIRDTITLFTSIVNMSVICFCLYKSLDAISIWANLKQDIFIIQFWALHMIFLSGHII